MKEVRVGIIGTGAISWAHIDGYKKLKDKGVTVVACCDPDENKAREYAKENEIPNVFTDYNEMLKMDGLDAVSVTTWNSVHNPATLAALRAGKHVLCEKPLALSVEQAEEMKAEADKAGLVLNVGFVMRFEKKVQIYRDFEKAGLLGNIHLAKVKYTRRNGAPIGWFTSKDMAGGGPVFDLGVHVVDISRYLMGNKKPVSVSAAAFKGQGAKQNIKLLERYRASAPFDIYDVEDLAVAFIRFEDGGVISLETSYTQHIEKDEISISFYGDKGGIDYYPQPVVHTDMLDYLADIKPIVEIGEDDGFPAEIAHFIDCVRGEAASIAPAQDGVDIMRILGAVYESAAAGKEVALQG
ncbi:MAG: Gfo/Idh/MocA family oxidoreductase [Oscillospiraceae bacterium]|jgi:predicted dehydrogenase|nr:Gfo/Idh/MocA family oxidoreductase [Oscillospiraceae bacterium]